MSRPELPDDPRDWPADPFELLGVRPGADDAELRRAYTRLIRRFKPEHYPEQFRRIREAYEACRSRRYWFFPDDLPGPEPAGDADPARPDGPTPAPAAPPADEADRLWDTAAGRESESYPALVALARSRPERADLPLRLYWLLALNPEHDPARTRHYWLADALARARLRGPAAELYRRELESSSAALYGAYRELLATAADAGDLLIVARWRVAAAGRAARYSLLADDLRAVRGRVVGHDDAGWLALLTAAAGWDAWAPSGDLTELISGELAGLRHLELSHGHLFDRLEETEYVASCARLARAQLVPEELLDLARAAWAEYGAVRLADVAPAAAAVAADPGRNLARLDRVVEAGGPGLPALVVRALECHRRMYGSAGEPEFPADLIRGVARRAEARVRRGHYRLVRADLLALLIDEAVDPLELAAACADDPDSSYRMLAGPLHNDLTLRAVWLAARTHYG